MAERLFGIETEYALSATDSRGVRISQACVVDGVMQNARRQLPYLPDLGASGVFLRNAARIYIDCGGHPEFSTPECNHPSDVVRYVRAGDAILLRLADGPARRRATGWTVIFGGNVDYVEGTTWGSHESYGHRHNPALFPPQIIPHLVSRLVYTGAGGFKNTSAGLEFRLSPRTTHITREISRDSTSNRGIYHDKREDLCANGYHRLHLLCGESLRSELGLWLRVGTTALVVALCEADVRPGAAVTLRDPVAAMHLFAADPTCRATAETVHGERLTAIAIQRHYLGQAEAHVGRPFMPSWAGEVCQRWRAILDRLELGWESVATTLDWAIKLGLYRDHVRRRGLAWESLAAWTSVVEKLSAACLRATGGERRLTAALARDPAGPIAADMKRMAATIARMGLRGKDLVPFLEVRDQLFEIDTRFGQLGPDGIFARLDAAGALSHRVLGVGEVEHAIDHPPDVPRARLRGALVRELAKNPDRYCCTWQGVWDHESGKCVDLSDPFAVTSQWQEWPRTRKDTPWRFLARVDERLPARRGRRRRSSAAEAPEEEPADETPDPVALNHAALAHRKRDELDVAERLLRQAIEIEDAQVAADSPKRPHRRNNLAIVLMRAEKLAAATELNADAWRLKAGQHDLTSGRVLFVRLALRYLSGDQDVDLYLGQLKTLLGRDRLDCLGDIMSTWDIPDVLTMLRERLDRPRADLLVTLAEVLNDRAHLASLDGRDRWRDAPAVPLEAPWVETPIRR